VLIFVHIPKTAGTSFKGLLSKIYTPSETVVIDSVGWYRDKNFSTITNRAGLPGAQKVQPNSNVKCITGHFNADSFIELYPDATYITWVRDPIQRLLSHYNYYLRSGHYYGQLTTEKRSYDIIDFDMYSTHTQNINLMSLQLNIPLSKFKFIGIVEKYDQEIERFKKTLGINLINDYNYANINPEKKTVKEKYSINDPQKEKLMSLHAEDFKLYNECIKLAGY
jgi:hypothetical protein